MPRIPFSRKNSPVRKEPTDAEKKLWQLLRRKQLDGYRFRRQVPIGPFIVDFACLAERLVIEVDGGQHAVEADKDARRTRWLEEKGLRVVRFWNNQVLGHPEGVIQVIQSALADGDTPLPDPPPQGGRGVRRRGFLVSLPLDGGGSGRG